MGNTAMKQCQMCKSTDVDLKQPGINAYYQCNNCGERWKQSLKFVLEVALSFP